MDYYVKKNINKMLILKIIFELLSFILFLRAYLNEFYYLRNIIVLILMLFSLLFFFIINLKYFKMKEFNSFIMPLIATIILLLIGGGAILSISMCDITKICFFGHTLLILISIGISINIQMILINLEKQNNIMQRAKEEEKMKQHSIGTSFTADSKRRLFGMIKLKKTLDLKETSEKLGLPQGEIENLLFDLAGENKISGDFKEGIFHITSDVDEFIGQLDDIFSEWTENENTKHMKI